MLNRRSLWPALAALLLLALLISACGPAAEPTPEPTPTRPLRPTFTPTPLPTDTPTVVPTDTPTPEPTATPTELPTDTPEPTATPEPAVIISGSAEVNVRSGPSAAYPVVGKVAQGTELKIVARNDAGDWWQVCCVNGNEVWIVDRLVEIQGDTDGIQVAANVPPPPTPRPVPPTNTPEPTPTPAPVYAFDKYANPPGRPNSNPYVTFWGMVYTSDLNNGVGGVTLVVDGPLGRKEADCSSAVLRGDPGLPSEFIYNCKVEFQGTADGVYRAWVADSGGAQQSDIWENTVSGEIRIFMPRWKQR